MWWQYKAKDLSPPVKCQKLYCSNLRLSANVLFICNKKVLLRERKRHTARHAASTPYVVLSLLTPPADPPPPCGWPTPPPRLTHPSPQLTHASPLLTHPSPVADPPLPQLTHPSPRLTHPSPPADPPLPPVADPSLPPPADPPWQLDLTPPRLDLTHPPCGQTEGQTRVKTLPSPILRMRAVINVTFPSFSSFQILLCKGRNSKQVIKVKFIKWKYNMLSLWYLRSMYVSVIFWKKIIHSMWLNVTLRV